LAHLAFGFRIDRQREVGMRLDVDESGRHYEPVGIRDSARWAGDASDFSNAAILDREVTGNARVAGAVEQDSAADQEVMHGTTVLVASRSRNGGMRRVSVAQPRKPGALSPMTPVIVSVTDANSLFRNFAPRVSESAKEIRGAADAWSGRFIGSPIRTHSCALVVIGGAFGFLAGSFAVTCPAPFGSKPRN